MFQYHKLAPNVHVIINPADRFRTNYSITFSSTGAYFEGEGEKGVTHLLEHCMVKRTKAMDEKQLRHFIFKNDLYKNASTGSLSLDVVFGGHKDNSEEMLEMMLEMAMNPYITQEVLDQERAIILREINDRRGDPSYRLSKLVQSEIFEEGSLNLYDAIGNAEDVEKATLETLETIHKRMLLKSHVVITASGGNVSLEQISEKFAQYLNLLDESQALAVDFVVPNVYKDFTFKPIVSELAHEQADMRIVIPFDVNLQNYPARSFIYRILLNPPHGILYNKLRNELGHVYHVDGSFDPYSKTFYIYVTCEISRVHAIIDEIKNVFNHIEESINDENIQILKDITVKEQQLILDNPREPVGFTEQKLFDYGVVIPLKEFIESLKNVTKEDLENIFNQMKENMDKMKILIVSKDKSIEDLY